MIRAFRLFSVCVFGLLAIVRPAHALSLGSIQFQACELGKAPKVVDAQCAKFAVAEDPSQPAGRRIDLSIAVIPALREQARQDVVVYLAGGPGQAATEVYSQLETALAPVHREHAILLVDQRGTGHSNALNCAPEDWKRADIDTPAFEKQHAESCLADVSKHADPRFYTTSDFVRDLEAVRVAIGSPRFDVMGGSYGTRAALEYLRRYPGAVRSLVLDGVVPPQVLLPQAIGANLDATVAKIFADCVANPDCHARFGNPQATLDGLMGRLANKPESYSIEDPKTGQRSDFSLTPDLLAGAIRFLAYQPESAALLPMMLDKAAKGEPQPMVAQLAATADTLQQSLAVGLDLSVVCAEDEPLMKPLPPSTNKAAKPAKSLIGEKMIGSYALQCSIWPRGAMPADFHSLVVSDVPSLLLSGEYDPVTPPGYAQQVAAGLSNSRSLVGKGQGHIQLIRGCTPRLVGEFIDTLKLQTIDASCFDALAPQPAFVAPSGPMP